MTRLYASFLQCGREGIFAACESLANASTEMVLTLQLSVARPHVRPGTITVELADHRT